MAKPRPKAPTGLLLRSYLMLAPVIGWIAPRHLARRLKRGKEDPARMQEKLGHPTQPRPDGRVVWLHAVGLGEVLALRGLINAMSARDPQLSFLVTSSARSSAQVMAGNLPPRTTHQYLPLDAPKFVSRFLDYWRPDMSIWAEQELWPTAIMQSFSRGIPLALVNARISESGGNNRQKAKSLFGDILARFSYISAQDTGSRNRLTALGATDIEVTGTLKSAAPALDADANDLAQLTTALNTRDIWVAASTHAGDETVVLDAQSRLAAENSNALLILVPRDPTRGAQIAQTAQSHALRVARRALGEVPTSSQNLWVADTFGELGLWYRLAETAFIGGGFDDIGGHNPWEAAHLNAAILHGPDTANFANDYAQLQTANAAREIADSAALVAALNDPELGQLAANAASMLATHADTAEPLAQTLLDLVEGKST